MNDSYLPDILDSDGTETPGIADDELATEFRVVITSQKRKGLRLEKIYWRLLKEIAERRGKKRSRLIASILEKSEESSVSNASRLRGVVTKTLEAERNQIANSVSENSIINLLHLAPVPSFTIDRQKNLKKFNKEFIQLLRVIGGDMHQNVSTESISLTLDTPIDTLFAELKQDEQTVCNYTLKSGDKHKRGRARIISTQPRASNMLIGFIVS